MTYNVNIHDVKSIGLENYDSVTDEGNVVFTSITLNIVSHDRILDRDTTFSVICYTDGGSRLEDLITEEE